MSKVEACQSCQWMSDSHQRSGEKQSASNFSELQQTLPRVTYLRLQTGDCRVEGGGSKRRSDGATNASLAGDVGIVANLIWRTRVIEAECFDKDLYINLVQIFGNTKETSRKVISRLNHAVLRLGAKDGNGASGSEII